MYTLLAEKTESDRLFYRKELYCKDDAELLSTAEKIGF